MTLQIDASSPAAAVGATATVTTASFSPPANSLLVAFVMSDANSGATNEQNTVTSTGGLSWTLKVRANGAPGANVEIWSAPAASAPGSITVSVTDNQGAVDQRLYVRVFTDSGGSIPAGIGATSTSAATSVGYTSTVNGSWGWAVGLGGGGAPTAGASQTLQDSDTALDGGDGTWVIDQTATTATAGTSVTMSVTAPSSVVHHAAAEILPMSTVAAATSTAGPWTAPAPGHVSPTGQWRVVLGDASAQAATSAAAEATSVTGTANDTVAALGATDPGTTATGAANDAVAALTVADPGTTATGAANDPVGSIGAQDGGTTATGAAQDPTPAVAVNEDGASATGTALDATVVVDWLNYAGPWTQVTPGWISPTGHLSPLLGDATTAVVPATSAAAEAATGTGTADDATVALTVTDPGTTATGTAQDPTPAIAVNDGGASATGTANDATVNTSSQTNAPAGGATATGTANDATAAVTIADPGTTATGTANDAVPSLAGNSEGAAVTGSALDPAASVTVAAGGAAATGTAYDASVAVGVLAEAAAVLAAAWDVATSVTTANATSSAAVTGRRTGTATVAARRTSSSNVSDG